MFSHDGFFFSYQEKKTLLDGGFIVVLPNLVKTMFQKRDTLSCRHPGGTVKQMQTRSTGLRSPRHPAPSSGSPRRGAGSPPGLDGRTRSPPPHCGRARGENPSLLINHPEHRSTCGLRGGADVYTDSNYDEDERRHLQLPGGLPQDGALLLEPLRLLVLQPFGHADVVLHQLALLNVGGVVVFDYEGMTEQQKAGRRPG